MTEPLLKLASDFEPATREAWLKLVDKAIKGADFEKRMVSRTADGLRIEPLYMRADAPASAASARPGEAPFTRGTGRARANHGWDIRTIHAETDPATANKAILEDLEGGANSLLLQIDGAGRQGLAPTATSLAGALEGVDLAICPVSLQAGDNAIEAARQLIGLWQARGIDADKRQGSLGADPLGTLALTGALAQDVSGALDTAAGLALETMSTPGVCALRVDACVYHGAGATEVQELGAMLATLVAYLKACEGKGLAPDKALPKIELMLAADTDQFLTIAKLRAARRLVWRVADACGAGGSAREVVLTAETAYRMLARRDPWSNILRATIACAAAAMGGADAVTVLPFTWALGKPDKFARRVARNIQIVLQEESHLGAVTDPAGGSWYVERLSEDLCGAAWKVFQEIEAKGGMAASLASGHIQALVAAAATARDKAVAAGRMELTGISTYPLLGDDGVKVEPWSKTASGHPATGAKVEPLRTRRLAEPFEAMRDAADAARAAGRPPRVFLASLGEIIDHNVRTTWIKNYLAAGGIETLVSEGYASAADAAAAFKASGAGLACICSSDAVYAQRAEATAKALKEAGAKFLLQAGRPGDREAPYKAAGVDQFVFAGGDAVATLKGLLARL